MPSRGINFSSTKPKTDSSALSSNLKTIVTRKWEHELGGLSLALHCINKAATVARGRAIAKVKSTSMYIEANEGVHEKLVQEALNEVNQKQELKRVEAQQEWIELYGEDYQDQNDERIPIDERREDDEDENDSSSILESVSGSISLPSHRFHGRR